MIVAIYARKSTDQTGIADEQKSVSRLYSAKKSIQPEPAKSTAPVSMR